MENAAKIWDATTEAGDVTITPIVEFLNNIKFLAAAYNQMWRIKKATIGTNETIAFVDDVTGAYKMVLVNPDPLMEKAIDEIIERGWFAVKEEHLIDNEDHEPRVLLTEVVGAPGLSEVYNQE